MKMKRLATSLLAGAFGALLLAPSTYAWETRVQRNAQIWQDRQAYRRHRAEYAARSGYYNGYYYYPYSYTYVPDYDSDYSYGYYGHRHHWHHWHHGHHHDDD